MSTSDSIDLVTRFCAAWADGDLDDRHIDALVEFFTDDAVYHNMPLDPVTGKEAIRATIAGFTGGVDSVEFRVDNLSGAEAVVLTERVDVFTTPAKTISLPVMGAFEVREGKIAAWRDYFDLNQFMSQLAG